MAYANTYASKTSYGPTFAQAIRSAFEKAAKKAIQYRQYRRDMQTLSRMSDHMLNDMGLTRDDVPSDPYRAPVSSSSLSKMPW